MSRAVAQAATRAHALAMRLAQKQACHRRWAARPQQTCLRCQVLSAMNQSPGGVDVVGADCRPSMGPEDRFGCIPCAHHSRVYHHRSYAQQLTCPSVFDIHDASCLARQLFVVHRIMRFNHSTHMISPSTSCATLDFRASRRSDLWKIKLYARLFAQQQCDYFCSAPAVLCSTLPHS